MIGKIIRVILVFCSLSASHHALGEDDTYLSSPDESDQDAAEMMRLMRILDEHTEIATKTRLNADYVPGMVTVLYGDDLEARGIQTVWEALRLVPGMDMPFRTVDGRDILVRGVADNYISGNTKILLDGVSMNSVLYAEASAVLQIPTELIDRIEVIRGPGSAIHGEFAYTSVVNIITQKEENLLFSGFGRYHDYRVGGRASWSDAEGNFHVSLRMSAAEMYDMEVDSGPDILYGMGMGSLSNAPGPVSEDRDSQSVLLDVGYHNTDIIFQHVRTGNKGAYGMSHVLPDPEAQNTLRSHQCHVEARHKMDFSSSLAVRLRLGWMKYQFKIKELMLFPPGFLGLYTDGMITNVFYEEQRLNGGIDLVWKGWDSHTLLLGYSASKTEMGDVWAEANFDPLTMRPLPHMQHHEGERNYLVENQSRTINSLTVQDEFRVSDAFTLTAGLRYDSYDDMGESFSPRVAAVWRITDSHILKVQYARAFRPPTFTELYSLYDPILAGNPDLGLSDIGTYEIGYVHKQDNTVVRATVFHSQLDNMVVQGEGKRASDQGEADAWGSELEIEQNLTHFLRLSGNLSYVNTEDKSHGEEIEGSANWLANASLICRPHEKTAFSLQYRYVGDRKRTPQDPREDLRGYHTVDITASFFNLCLNGLTIRAGIKNLFDEDARTPTAMDKGLLGNPILTYPEDYSHAGREWWLKLSYNF